MKAKALLALTIALLVGVAGLTAYSLWGQPVNDPEAIVNRFVRLLQTDRAAALRLLGPEKEFGETPVPEAEADSYYTDFYLRTPRLKVVRVLPGEPDGARQRPVPDRFTIVTNFEQSTPTLKVRLADGRVVPQNLARMTTPDLVVEVRDGKIFALRCELPLR